MVTSFGVNSSTKLGSRARATIALRFLAPREAASSARAARAFDLLEAHPPTAAEAFGIGADELDTRGVEGLDHLRERVDDASYVAFARLHPLDRRQRHARQLGKLPLV